jgi:hypothetical protein
MDKLEVRVILEPDEETGMVNIKIDFPPDQVVISVKDTANILTAGISTLIKGCSVYDMGIKDYELIKEVMDQLTTDFSSIENYDVILNKKKND